MKRKDFLKSIIGAAALPVLVKDNTLPKVKTFPMPVPVNANLVRKSKVIEDIKQASMQFWMDGEIEKFAPGSINMDSMRDVNLLDHNHKVIPEFRVTEISETGNGIEFTYEAIK